MNEANYFVLAINDWAKTFIPFMGLGESLAKAMELVQDYDEVAVYDKRYKTVIFGLKQIHLTRAHLYSRN